MRICPWHIPNLQQLEFVFYPDKTIVDLTLRFECFQKLNHYYGITNNINIFLIDKISGFVLFLYKKLLHDMQLFLLFFKKEQILIDFQRDSQDIEYIYKKMWSECM